MCTFVVLMEFHALQREKLYDAMQEKIWVSEQPLMWFDFLQGQIYYEEDAFPFEPLIGYGGDLELKFCTDIYDNESGRIIVKSTDRIYLGVAQYSARKNKITIKTADRDYQTSESIFAGYKVIEFIGYDKEAFAEKYPQFNLFTLEEYEKENKVGNYRE